MKYSHALILASSLALFACGDDDDSPTSAKSGYDCTVSDGVKVVYPAGGETFTVGDEITVVFGSDVEDNGYKILFRTDADDLGFNLSNESEGPEGKADGKTCYEVKVKLSAENGVKPTTTGFITVRPYNKGMKGGDSKTFTVKK